jgi:hypothetical protein
MREPSTVKQDAEDVHGEHGKKKKRWEAAEAASHRLGLRRYGIVTLLAEQQEPFPDTEMTW